MILLETPFSLSFSPNIPALINPPIVSSKDDFANGPTSPRPIPCLLIAVKYPLLVFQAFFSKRPKWPAPLNISDELYSEYKNEEINN